MVRCPQWLLRPTFWTWAAIVLGLALRGYYYFRDLPVWHDEAALLVNVLGKSFAEQCGPLFLHEAAPPGFLWAERAVRLLLGDGTWALRLLPFLASCAALVLLARLAGRWLAGPAAPIAVLLFAVADRLLWHACEAKPYAVDVLLAVLVLTLHDLTRDWTLGRRFLLYASLSPLLVFTSYPGCFLCGGLLVVTLPAVWRAGCWRTWAGYAGWAAVVAASFLLLLLGPIRAQRCTEMDSCWVTLFPDLSRPLSVPGWLVWSSSGVVHYAINPIGEYLAAFALLGAWWLWRHGRPAEVVLMLIPVGLPLAASFLHAYPFGGARVMAYAVPAVVLLVAAGLVVAASWLRTRHRLLPLLLVPLVALPVANSLHRLVVPWVRADARAASEHILARYAPGDQVRAGNWEYLYYFRKPPADLHFAADGPPAADRRVWQVVTEFKDAARRDLVARSTGGRAVLAQQEFPCTTVLLLAPVD